MSRRGRSRHPASRGTRTSLCVAGAPRNARGCGATAQRGAGIPSGMRPLRGMQASLRSLASAPLPDPATRVPRATLRGARIDAGRRHYDAVVQYGLVEAAR